MIFSYFIDKISAFSWMIVSLRNFSFVLSYTFYKDYCVSYSLLFQPRRCKYLEWMEYFWEIHFLWWDCILFFLFLCYGSYLVLSTESRLLERLPPSILPFIAPFQLSQTRTTPLFPSLTNWRRIWNADISLPRTLWSSATTKTRSSSVHSLVFHSWPFSISSLVSPVGWVVGGLSAITGLGLPWWGSIVACIFSFLFPLSSDFWTSLFAVPPSNQADESPIQDGRDPAQTQCPHG